MKTIEVKDRLTLDGLTYPIGVYKVVAGNDAGTGEITEARAEKLLHNNPDCVFEQAEQAEEKPAESPLKTRKLK